MLNEGRKGSRRELLRETNAHKSYSSVKKKYIYREVKIRGRTTLNKQGRDQKAANCILNQSSVYGTGNLKGPHVGKNISRVP